MGETLRSAPENESNAPISSWEAADAQLSNLLGGQLPDDMAHNLRNLRTAVEADRNPAQGEEFTSNSAGALSALKEELMSAAPSDAMEAYLHSLEDFVGSEINRASVGEAKTQEVVGSIRSELASLDQEYNVETAEGLMAEIQREQTPNKPVLAVKAPIGDLSKTLEDVEAQMVAQLGPQGSDPAATAAMYG